MDERFNSNIYNNNYHIYTRSVEIANHFVYENVQYFTLASVSLNGLEYTPTISRRAIYDQVFYIQTIHTTLLDIETSDNCGEFRRFY